MRIDLEDCHAETTPLVGSYRHDSNIDFDIWLHYSRVPSDNQESAPLQQVADVPLLGPAVRFDDQSLDASHGRLYIAHMNADRFVVFDTKKREVVANLDGFPNVHGVWAVPELGGVYAAATGESPLWIWKPSRPLQRLDRSNIRDGIAYAPGAKRVFVSDEHGNADAVIDATTNSLVATIPLDGGAGNTVYDSGSGHVLVFDAWPLNPQETPVQMLVFGGLLVIVTPFGVTPIGASLTTVHWLWLGNAQNCRRSPAPRRRSGWDRISSPPAARRC